MPQQLASRHYDGQFTAGHIDDFEIWNGVARPDAGTIPSATLSVYKKNGTRSA